MPGLLVRRRFDRLGSKPRQHYKRGHIPSLSSLSETVSRRRSSRKIHPDQLDMSVPAVFEPSGGDGPASPRPSGNKLVRLDQAESGGSGNHASMQVREAMTANVICCTPQTTLGATATLMAEGRCRSLPVVLNGKTVAMVTDRDICLALAAAQCLPSGFRSRM